ncbi:hypothetical protein E1B28_006804 [Marasmius oreades]|uniref:Uncharacterized protein n=1 Tax=Marasmius oreades TaxID=181124 RepID=A0A9P7UWU9_9AGAR|nr:uncharacterized protein E1B28_006804 [Marasmius oreades]KAG7096130.1 hypothetical protein E1B28_006804 [Marasmius oreades]
MLKVLEYAASCSRDEDCDAENINLFLLSFFDAPLRSDLCSTEVITLESQIRAIQAFDVLLQLQGQLHSWSAVYSILLEQLLPKECNHFKDQVETRVKAFELSHNYAREAMLRLRGPGRWEDTFRPLKAEDIRGFGEHTLRVEEVEELRQSYERAGVSKEAIVQALDGPNAPTITHHPLLNRGETNVPMISWIWYVVWPVNIEGEASPPVTQPQTWMVY